MRIIDISQEVLSCKVYPGDPAPRGQRLMNMDEGELYNLSAFSMGAHNGTHVDAPAHFIKDGNTVEKLSLESFVGECYVARFDGEVSESDAVYIMHKAAEVGADKRILIAGSAVVTAAAARVFTPLLLIGNESQSVGPEDAPMEVHKILLSSGTVLLEGVVLDGVKEGRYFLSAAPLNLSGFEGAPVRAYLIEE